MILLVNLNRYIGGGETLLIRLAQYLHDNGYNYAIMTFYDNCWIKEESARRGLNCCFWPSVIDSVNYQTERERAATVHAINDLLGYIKELRVFTFCMRDLQNVLYVFTRIKNSKVWFSHGIYHPEDVYYLSSLSFNPGQIIEKNRQLIRELYFARSVIFVNKNGLKISLDLKSDCSEEADRNTLYAPLPITLGNKIPQRLYEYGRPFRIICISRFVVFKVAAVLAIVRYAGNRNGVELLVIGHGPWKFVIDVWMKLKRINNIKIITGVSPDRLDSYIDTCDLGYAQGTSILEIAKRGLPVLIAPYSRLRDLFNKKFPTLGIFGDIRDFSTFGDITDLSGINTYSISESINTVQNNYAHYQQQSIEYVKTFDEKLICKQIVNIINNSEYSNQGGEYRPSKAPLIKLFLRKLMSKK